jgi:uncharacterized membrane protein YfcA
MSLEDIFTSYPLYITIFCIYLSGVIASAGGIGGGGVVMPLLLVLGKFPIHQAIILSQCAVFGNNFAQSYINFTRSHPYDVHRPLIYYDIVMVILPSQLGGSFIGVLIAKIFPETILIILAIVTLIYAIYRTFNKAMIYYRSENEMYTTNQTMYEKLLEKSIHSPTKIGKRTIYSEQVSICFDEEDVEHGDNGEGDGEGYGEIDDSFGRLIGSYDEEREGVDVIEDVNTMDDPEAAKLVHATTRSISKQRNTNAVVNQPRKRDKVKEGERERDNRVGMMGGGMSPFSQNVSISGIGDTSSAYHSDADGSQSQSSHRMDSTEFFRDTSVGVGIGGGLAAGGPAFSSDGAPRYRFDSYNEIRPAQGEAQSRTFRESEDTVLFNPLTLSLNSSKVVTNVLLKSALLPFPPSDEERQRKKKEKKQKRGEDGWQIRDDDEESEESDRYSSGQSSSRQSSTSTGRRSLMSGQHITMIGGIPISTPPSSSMIGIGGSSNVILRILPMFQLSVIVLIWLLYCVLYIVMKFTSEECSLRYFLEMFSIYPILIGTVIYVIRYLQYYQHHHDELQLMMSNNKMSLGGVTNNAQTHHQPSLRILQGDIDFAKSLWAWGIPCGGFIVGILTSLLGIGGGELLGPLFLAYHMLPQVSTATTSMMSLLNSANNIVHYAVLGKYFTLLYYIKKYDHCD